MFKSKKKKKKKNSPNICTDTYMLPLRFGKLISYQQLVSKQVQSHTIFFLSYYLHAYLIIVFFLWKYYLDNWRVADVTISFKLSN